MRKIKEYLQKKIRVFGKKELIFFVFLLVFGIFLRGYNFSDWIHFELDQARDAALVQEAMDGGIGKLPLLGPRAAGTFLRLGPSFYYMEYIFSKVFNDAIVGSALLIFAFSVLSIPVFYLLFSRYFSKKNSLLLTSIFSVSLYVVTYSRFAWNPNLLPFFILIFLFSLLILVDEKTNPKKRGRWLVGAAFFYGILSQLHFLALIILSAVALIFLIYKRPKIKIKYWVAAFLVLLLLYVPVFINDYKTKGLNSQLFLKAVTKKSEEDNHNLPEKFIRNLSENADYYWVIMTGSQTVELPDVDLIGGVDVKCDRYCRDHLWEGALACLLFVSGIGLLIWRFLRTENGPRKDFIVLSSTLFGFSFLIFTPLAFDYSARFFLIILPLPFVFVGLFFDEIERMPWKNKTFKRFLICFLAFLFIVPNVFFVRVFLQQLNNAKDTFFELPKDKILKQKTRITLEQEMAITDYMEKFYQQNKYPVMYHGQSEFHRSFAFILDSRKIPRDGLKTGNICKNANYFLIFRTQSDLESLTEKYRAKFDFIEERKFGTLTVFHLVPQESFITCEEFDQSKFRNYKNEGGAAAKRYTWEEIFREDD